MDADFAADLLSGMSQRVPDQLIQFGRALNDAEFLVDGWPYFLEKSWKWAAEYAAWTELYSPQSGDETFDAWVAKVVEQDAA